MDVHHDFSTYINTQYICRLKDILMHKKKRGGKKLVVLWAKSLSVYYFFLYLQVLKHRDFHFQGDTWFFKTNTIKEIKSSLQGQNHTGQPSKQSLLPSLSYKTFNKLSESTGSGRHSCTGTICQAQDASWPSSHRRTNDF